MKNKMFFGLLYFVMVQIRSLMNRDLEIKIKMENQMDEKVNRLSEIRAREDLIRRSREARVRRIREDEDAAKKAKEDAAKKVNNNSSRRTSFY